MLDATYRDTQSSCYIWTGDMQGKVFPNGPKVRRIFDRLGSINDLRNRLFHHEPIWNGEKVTSIHDAIAKLKTRYSDLLEVLGWMSVDQRDLLISWGFEGRLNLACDITRFDRALWA